MVMFEVCQLWAVIMYTSKANVLIAPRIINTSKDENRSPHQQLKVLPQLISLIEDQPHLWIQSFECCLEALV
jgi:hypothetical protein